MDLIGDCLLYHLRDFLFILSVKQFSFPFLYTVLLIIWLNSVELSPVKVLIILFTIPL